MKFRDFLQTIDKETESIYLYDSHEIEFGEIRGDSLKFKSNVVIDFDKMLDSGIMCGVYNDYFIITLTEFEPASECVRELTITELLGRDAAKRLEQTLFKKPTFKMSDFSYLPQESLIGEKLK